MNAKFVNLFNEYGLVINNNSAYGVIKGYETNANIQIFDNNAPVRIHISFYAPYDTKMNIEKELKSSGIKYFQYGFTEYGVEIRLNDITVGMLIKRMPEIIDKVYGILANNGALNANYCPLCGNEMREDSRKTANIDGFTINLDEACISKLNIEIAEENKDFTEAPNNYLRGFFGALIGGLLGALVAVILYFVGFISSLSAFLAVFAGAYFYRKFDGKPNKTMIAIVAGTTLVCMMASVFVIYLLGAALAAEEAQLAISAFEAFNICMEDAEFAQLFYTDLGSSVFFSLIGIGYQVYTLSKSIKRKTEIR